MTTSPAIVSGVQLLVFELGRVRYAIDLRHVREIARAVMIVPLPGAPEMVEGIIRARGEIVPVYDLRLRFGHAAERLDPEERMVIAWTGDRLAAFRCDRADRIDLVDPADVEDLPPLTRGGERITGVATLRDGLVLIHDLGDFLDASERAALGHALDGISSSTE